MMSKKSDNLYNAMKSEGLVKESYNDFLVNMRDPAKRTQMFNKAQKSGFFGSENTVEQFTRVVAPNAVTDKAQPTTATQSTQPKQKGFTPSLQQRIAAQNTFANTTANFNSYSNALKEDLGTRQTNSRKGMKFGSDIKDTRLVEKTDAETGKTTTEIERPMYSTSGAEVTNEIDKIRQDEANRANASYVEMQKFAETPQGKLYMGKALDTEADYNAAMKYLDDEEKRLAGQLDEAKKKAVDEFNSKSWWQRLGQMGPEPAESTIGNELFKTEETSAIEQSMTRVQEARRHLEQAHRVKTQDKELAKEDNKAVRNLKDFGYGTQNALRGFANTVPTWLDPFDLKSLEENGNLGRIVEKQKNGKQLTKAEQDMLDAEMLKQSVEGEYDTGTGYGTIGQTTGELVNFGLSIMLNPLNGFGSGLAKGATRFLVKNLGKSVATKLARGAIRIGGDIVEGAAAALTTRGAITVDDVVHRHVGNFKGGMVDGNWRAVGTEGGESWGSAIVKGITAQTIENQSELVGAYFAPLLKGVGKYGKNAIVATINKLGGKAGEKAIGKATDFIAKYSGTRGVQLLDGYLKRAGWHGSVGEFGEEIVGGVEDAVTVHDQTLDTNKNTGVFNWDNMVDTALGVGVSSLVLGHLGAGGYAVTRAKLNRSYNSALKQMLEQFGNNGEAIQNKMDEMDDQQFTDYVSAQLQNKNLSEDQRSALWGYAKALKAKQYLNLSEASDIAQGMVTMVDQNKDRAFTIGYNSNGQNIGAQLTSKAKLYDDAMRRFGKKRTAELQKMTDSEAVNSLDNDRDKQMWLDVINAREAYRGAIQSRIDNREEELVEAYREANKLADTNGNVVTATDADGNKVNIISGEIVRDTNGVIDNEKSGKLVVVDADGKRRMVEASAIASVDNTTPLKDYFEPIGQGIMDKYITEEAMQKLVVGNTLPIISTSSAEPVQATIVNIDANGNVSYYIGDNPRTIITTNATHFLYSNIDAEENEGTREEVEYAERGNVQWNPQNQQGQQVQPTAQLDENGEQINPQINEAQPTETEQETNQTTNQTTEQTTEPKTYQQGQQVALADENGEQVDATIDSQPNEDGKFIVTFDKPINGTRVAQLSADEISALEYQSTESQTETDPTQTDGSADNSPALSRIPKDKKGQPIYEQTDANTAWDAIVEQTEGDEELAKTVADSMVADKEAALKKAEKLKGKGATVSEKIANIKAVAQAEAELAHWKEIASTLDRRKQTTEETTSNAEESTANAEESTETAPQAAEQVNVEKPEEATPVEETAPTEADKVNAEQPTEVKANEETEAAPVAETETTNEETPTEVEKPTEEAPTEVTDNNMANAEVEAKEETPTEENAGTETSAEETQEIADNAEKEKAPKETVSPLSEENVEDSAIPFDASAKVGHNLDKRKESYRKRDNKTRGFITDVSMDMGLNQDGASHYRTFTTKDGKTFTFRISNHNANAERFGQRGENEGISIVISRGRNKGIQGREANAHVQEFFYPKKAIEAAKGKPLVDIIDSLKDMLETGEYVDRTGIAVPDEVNGRRQSAEKPISETKQQTSHRSKLDIVREMAERADVERKAGTRAVRHAKVKGRKAIETVADALGYKVEWVPADSRYNGKVDHQKKVITIAEDAEMPLEAVMGHEATHAIRRLGEEQYTKLRDAVRELVGEDAWNALIEQKRTEGNYTDDKVEEEVTADLVGRVISDGKMMGGLAQKLKGEPTILGKLREIFQRLVDALTKSGNTEAADVMKRNLKAFDAVVESFTEAAEKRDAFNQNVSGETLEELNEKGLTMQGGVVMNEDAAKLKEESGYLTPIEQEADPLASAVDHSRRTMGRTIYYLGQKQVDKDVVRVLVGFNNRLAAKDAVAGLVGRFTPDTDTPVKQKYDENGNPISVANKKQSPLREQGDIYMYSFDIDTSCPRTFTQATIAKEIERRLGYPLNLKQYTQLSEVLRAIGVEIPCTYCYVENKRAAKKDAFFTYTRARNGVFKAKTAKEERDVMYGQDASKPNGLTKAANEVLTRWRKQKQAGDTYAPSMEYLFTQYFMSRNAVLYELDEQLAQGKIDKYASEDSLTKHIVERFKIAADKKNFIDKGAIARINGELGEIVNEWKNDIANNRRHDDYNERVGRQGIFIPRAVDYYRDMVLYANSSSGAKKISTYIPYTDELDLLKPEEIDALNAIDGLRLHGNNDFRLDYLPDYMQFFAHASTKGLKSQTYTKNPDFVEIFGNIGVRINMSIAAYGGADGHPVMENQHEGMAWKTAEMLAKRYPNAGAMLMAVNDEQLSFALNCPWITMCIPFHASGLLKEYWYDLRKWFDYSSVQSEKFWSTDDKKKRLRAAGVEIKSSAKADVTNQMYEEQFGKPKTFYGLNSEKKWVRKAPHFEPGDRYYEGPNGEKQLVPGHHNDKETYLRLCDEYGVKPRFYGVMVKDADGNKIEITQHPNYMKVVKEVARTDSEQGYVDISKMDKEDPYAPVITKENFPILFGEDYTQEYNIGRPMTGEEWAWLKLYEFAKRGGYGNEQDYHKLVSTSVLGAGGKAYDIAGAFIENYVEQDRPLGWLMPDARDYAYVTNKAIMEEYGRMPYEREGDVDYSARNKKTASIERSDADSHNSSYRSLPAERNVRLSGSSSSAQQVDAKVMKNTQSLLADIRKVQNQGHFTNEKPITTPSEAVRVLGKDLHMNKAHSTLSYYGDYYETDFDANGTTIKLRIATHPATGERMGIADADKKISLVVYKNGEHKANKAHDGYSEYVYYPEKVSPQDAAFAIVDGVKSLIETGKFTDSTGKVEIQHYPYVDKDGTVQYSTRRHSDAEKEMAEIRYRRSDELTEEYGDRWLSEQTNEDGRHTTQVKNTINSYKKFGEWVKTDSKGKDVSILDASSGLGLGTEWMRENGMTVDDVEPYPSESRKAPTFASYDDIDKKYDYVISNAVLNVIPDDWRANVLHDMADKLKVGGKMVINVRGANTIAKQGKEGVTRITLDDPSEILVLRPDGTIKAYQKGFTKDELKKWCEKELGDGYSVEIATKKNAGDSYDTAVVVAKNNESNTSGIASGQGHPRWSAQPVPNSTANLSNKTEIANELNGISAELERKGEFGAHEFLYYMSKAFGYKGTSLKDSYYKSLGNNVGIRIADHYASADNFEKKGNDNENYGLVVKLSPHRFKDNDRVDYLEYVYFPDKLDGKRQADIVKGLKTFVQTGDFSALPHPDKVNPSGKFKRQQKNNRAVLNELVNRFNKAGIPVDMSEEGQRVIDAVNNGETAPDGARMFRTREGEVYGFVKDGKVYLDPRIATSETAIHEYTHLFGDMVRATDSKQWAHLVNELKGSVLWNEVKQTYKELKTDDEIADEVFATFSGRHGAERIDQEAERILSSDRSKLDKAVALAALQNVRDAIRSFWRKVAELFGIHRMRSAEELADMALADLLDAKNPLREETENNKARYQFIGEKGAESADHAEEVTTRLDNLAVAREMEDAKKDAKTIKMATGWERGADGKWRYEIEDVDFVIKGNARFGKLLEKQPWAKEHDGLCDKIFDGIQLTDAEQARFNELSKLYKDLRDTYENADVKYLDDYVRDSELFNAYPELRQTKVLIGDWATDWDGKYSSEDNTIYLNARGYTSYQETVAHEIQHAIQRIEGFARGGNTQMSALKETQEYKDWEKLVARLREETPEEKELNSVINSYSKEYEELANRIDDYFFNSHDAKSEESTRLLQNRKKDLEKLGNKIDELMDKLEDLGHKRGEKVQLALDSVNGVLTNLYNRLAGEVEARNVSKRLDMSAEERRNTLAEETEDVARKDQIFLFGENGDSHMGSRTNRQMKEIGEYFKDSQLNDEERAIVDVFSGKRDRQTINIKNYEGADVRLEMQQGNESHAGTKHSIYRHYKTAEGAISADEMRLIPDIVKNGSRVDKGNNVIYQKKINGVRFTVYTDKKGSKELFHDFYSNRNTAIPESLSGESTNTQLSARTSDNAVSATNVTNNADTDNNSVDYSTRAQARDRYETRVKSGLFQTQESLQNSMLGLQEALLAVDRASGNKRHIEDIEDWENPVLGENRLSSVNKAEIDAAASLLFHPLMETVSKLTDHGKNMQELTDYMMAKHGLERNLVMAKREAKKKAQEEFSKDLAKAKKALAKDPNNKTLQDAVKKVEDDINARATTLRNEYRLKDYAGITALAAEYDSITESYIDQIAQVDEQISQTTDKVTRGQLQAQRKVLQSALLRQAESVAQRIDYDYETKHANDMVNVNGVDKMLTTVLWEQTNAVTDATLSKARECGFLTNEQYADISSMYSFYIPLRGFDVQTSAEAYAYLNHGESAFNAPIKRAKGRKSKADNPFAYMQSMMESGILQGNRNVLVKQSLLNFALNHPSDLMSVSELWLQYDAVNDEWIPVTPTIDENHPTKTVAEQMDDFEASMQNLSAQSPDLYKKASDAVNIPYRVVEKTQLNEHQVLVRKNGKDYIVTINGNPRAAQAANGLTNPDSEKGAIGAVLSLGDAINRKLAAFYTTRNPDFTMSNFVRDMIYSNTMVWVKESPSYALTFHKNCTKFNPIYLTKLFKKWEAGKLDLNNKDEKLIYEFMRNGGETGYVAMKDIEQRKSDIAKEIKRIGKCSVYNGWRLLIDEWDELNRSVENCARVAAYVTSREKGRSIGRAIYDAKEISVNFNRKGSGATFVGANEQTKIGNIAAVVSGLGRCGYLFWNAGIQGLTNYGRQFKRHPGKAWSLVAGLFLAGFIKALAGGDDDDDDENNYYNLPEYVRRSSICIKAGDSWVTIPLSVEYRSMYGLGELAASVATGHESGDTWEITQSALGQVSQILPLDLMEGGGGHALIPSSVKPAWEAFHNEGWTGLPIYKETTYNKYMPNWTKAYKSTNKQLVNLSAMLNEWTGGDDYTKGGVDLNPARIEYIMRGYLGGMFGLTNNLVKVAEITTGKRDFEWQSVPIADRFIKTADERTQYRALSNEYYKMKEEADETSSRASGYLKGAKMGKMEYLKKLDEFMNSKAYERKLYFDAYDKAIKKIREAMQYTTDTKQLNEMQQDIYRLQREALSEIDSISSVNK